MWFLREKAALVESEAVHWTEPEMHPKSVSVKKSNLVQQASAGFLHKRYVVGIHAAAPCEMERCFPMVTRQTEVEV